MNKTNIKSLLCLLLLTGLCMVSLHSCSEDDDAPAIDGVWYNMVKRPVEQTTFAYPGEMLCIHGSGFGSLKMLMVNGTQINLNNIIVYTSDNYITFQVPSDVNTTGDNIRVVTSRGKADYTFIIRPKDEQPTLYYDKDSGVIPFSTTTLVPGNTLSIRGTNLGGVTEVWLPLAFGGKIKCEFDDTKENTDEYIYVKIPEAANFATGQCEVIFEKTDAARGITYTEKVYSEKTNFSN